MGWPWPTAALAGSLQFAGGAADRLGRDVVRFHLPLRLRLLPSLLRLSLSPLFGDAVTHGDAYFHGRTIARMRAHIALPKKCASTLPQVRHHSL